MPRLGDDTYKKPKQTYTDKLTKDDIRQKLEEYQKTDDISTVPIGSHIRYFSKDKEGVTKFRMGGIIINNKGVPKYIVLSNGYKTWSVQIQGTIFFYKISTKTLKEEFAEKIKEYDEKIKSLRELNKDLSNKNTDLINENIKLKKVNKNK